MISNINTLENRIESPQRIMLGGRLLLFFLFFYFFNSQSMV
jgi:hypothetical protein